MTKLKLLQSLFGLAFIPLGFSNASAQTSNAIYNSTSVWVVFILLLVLLLITFLLVAIHRNLKKTYASKLDHTEQEPSFYEKNIYPITSKWNKTIATMAIGTFFLLLFGGWAFMFGKNEVGVQQGYAPTQPINYSHKLHAGDLQIDCQYCHSTASYSKHASIPPASTCMNCHAYVQLRDNYDGKISPEIQKIYDAIGFDGENREYIADYEQKPIEWVRIHNLPDLAYFNHSQHVKVGNIECQVCHGPIEEMEKVYQYSTLQMGWCINCHRQRGIDVENNDYYEDVHKEMKEKGKTYVSVAENGGLDCSKCHY